MNFLNIPANYNFLGSLYNFISDKFKDDLDKANLSVFLPSRRSVNELKKIFLENSRERSTILPTIKAIGDVDYDDILLTGLDYDSLLEYHELTVPVSNIKYKLLLIKAILENYRDINIKQAINLSDELSSFIKEVEQQELSFGNLDNIVDDEYAIHWQKILVFLKDFGKRWEKFLDDNNVVSSSVNIINKIKLFTKNFENQAPKYPIIVAGNFVSIKATTNFIKTLNKYDNTYFIFKDFDDIKAKYKIEDIDEINNNYYFYQVINDIKIDTKQIKNIEYDEYKVVDDNILKILHTSMLPHELTYTWRNEDVKNPDNLEYMECKNIYEEFTFISYYILNHIQKNGLSNIAIISNPKQADKLELYLKMWNIPTNNAFGKKFINNKLVKYLLLVLETRINNFSKEYLLALLKSDFSYFGYTKDELVKYIVDFEKYVLSETNNSDGLVSYRKNILYNVTNEEIKNRLLGFIDRIDSYFSVLNDDRHLMKDLIVSHLKLVDEITQEQNIQSIWLNEDKIFEFFNRDLLPQVDFYDTIDIEEYYSILTYILSEQSYSDNYSINEAVNIISPAEARLINYDLVVITELNDGVFPLNISTDPWMSKSMRKSFGLPAKEIDVGKSCYDFIQLLSQKHVLLTRSVTDGDVSTFKSRFLQRLETYLKCNNLQITNLYDTFLQIYKKINLNNIYADSSYKVRPCPKPQKSVRPNQLSATNIDLLNKNPYDIYAKYILKLRPMNVLIKNKINAKIGTLMHSAIEDYTNNYEKYKDSKFNSIKQLFIDKIKKTFIDDDVAVAFYSDNFDDGIRSFIEWDDNSRLNGYDIHSENKKEYYIRGINKTITAKIDRIEQSNNTVNIVDYKTGTIPRKSSVLDGESLQLLVEALILSRQYRLNVASLQYWGVKHKDSKTISIDNNGKDVDIVELINKTEKLLTILLGFFDDENNGYVATNRNGYSDYKHLSRIADWLSN